MSRAVFIILATCLYSAWGVVFKESRQASHLRVRAFSTTTAESVIQYAVTCSALVDKTLAAKKAPQEFLELEECLPADLQAPAPPSRIRFSQDTEIQEVTFQLMRALVQRHQREMFGKNAPHAEITDFLAAALTFRRLVSILSTAGGPDWDYAVAHQQFEQKRFPNAELLLTAPVTPEHPLFFQLYAMHSEVLLKTIERLPSPGGVTLCNLLEMEAFGREARESVPYVLGRLLPVGTSLQTWYERYAPRLIGRNQASDTSSSILARIQALEQIQVLQAGGSNGGSLTSVKIDDVPHAFHDLKIDKVALNKRQVQFLEMRSSAPALLRPSLELYARAMGYLASDDVRRFQATIAQARQELQEALARQQSIARALRQAESEYVPATRRFSNYLDILSRHRKSQEKLLPLENP